MWAHPGQLGSGPWEAVIRGELLFVHEQELRGVGHTVHLSWKPDPSPASPKNGWGGLWALMVTGFQATDAQARKQQSQHLLVFRSLGPVRGCEAMGTQGTPAYPQASD